MTRHAEIFARARAVIQRDQFEPARYVGPDKVSLLVSVQVGAAENEMDDDGAGGRRNVRKRVIGLPADPSEGGIAKPLRGGAFEIGGERWTIDAFMESAPGLHRLACVRVERIESQGRFRG